MPIWCILQTKKNLHISQLNTLLNPIYEVFLGITPQMSFFFLKNLTVNILPLGHSNFMWNFRKKLHAILQKKMFTYSHTDLLTYWPNDFKESAFTQSQVSKN